MLDDATVKQISNLLDRAIAAQDGGDEEAAEALYRGCVALG